MKPIPTQLTELVVECRKIRITLTGPSARLQLSGVLQRASEQMLLPLPEARRKLRRRMLESLAQGRPVWDRNGEHGNPAAGATVLWPKEVQPKVLAVIDEDGNVLPSAGTTPEQVEEIKRLLAEDDDDELGQP